ncbi:MAG TPA: MarR family transcriptional regulator [bacterium]|nr:MarR family transcriptional regulator [bacterium]
MTLAKELGYLKPIASREHEAVLNVLMTAGMMTREGDRILRPFGMTGAQLNVLILLGYQAHQGCMTQSDLADKLLVNRSNVTGLVDRMQRAGWVERIPDPQDRRVNLLRLTTKGRGILEKVEPVYFERIHSVMNCITPNEQKELCTMLERVRAEIRGGLEQ